MLINFNLIYDMHAKAQAFLFRFMKPLKRHQDSSISLGNNFQKLVVQSGFKRTASDR